MRAAAASVTCDLSVLRQLWEGHVRKHRQRQKQEEERVSRSALTRVDQEWQRRIARRKQRSVEVTRGQPAPPTLPDGRSRPDDGVKDPTLVFQLTGGQWMKLPEDLQFRTFLREWHMEGTRIPEIPTYIEFFLDLRVMDIPRNGLTRLPAEMGRLASLRDLNISYNKLRSIPPELGECEKLERLEMTANSLSELPFEVPATPGSARPPLIPPSVSAEQPQAAGTSGPVREHLRQRPRLRPAHAEPAVSGHQLQPAEGSPGGHGPSAGAGEDVPAEERTDLRAAHRQQPAASEDAGAERRRPGQHPLHAGGQSRHQIDPPVRQRPRRGGGEPGRRAREGVPADLHPVAPGASHSAHLHHQSVAELPAVKI